MRRALLQPCRPLATARPPLGIFHESTRSQRPVAPSQFLYRVAPTPFVLRPSSFGARGIVIQRRFMLGGAFKLARSGFAIAAGVAAGGAAYTKHKFSEATGYVNEKLDKAAEWAQGMWDKLPTFDSTAGGGPNSPDANSNAKQSTADSGGNDGNSSEGSGGGNSNSDGGENGGEALAGTMMSLATPNNENSFDDQVYDMDNQMINLTRKMIEIRNILLHIDGEDKVQLPSIVVIGSQSSGKSSVLEAIVGHEFLPKGSSMVTRRPIELTLVHTFSKSGQEYCEFPALRLGHITNFHDVQRTLTDMNRAVPASEVVSDEPIQLRIYSPNVPDLTLIDLPGYIQAVAADQPLELKSKIAALCEKYIQPPNVILAVSAADVDLANSTALRASQRVDPDGLRTIGVLSKMDLVDPKRGVAILNTREYPLRMGYVGVVTKLPPSGIANSLFGGHSNMTRQISETEREFFKDPEYRNVTWGVVELRQKLMRVLEKSMIDSLEPARRNIRKELDETSYRFKVQYNDRVLTPQTYLAQCADSFKVGFQDMSTKFGRDQVRELIKQSLDQKVLDLLAEKYWNPPPEVLGRATGYLFSESDEEAMSTIANGADLSNLSSPKPDMMMWQSKVEQLSAAITKLGVGRLSTTILVDAISDRMKILEASSSFKNNPLALEQIDNAAESILSNKFYATADQIENSIKPFKYEVEVYAREWKNSREYAYSLLQEELRQCNAAYDKIKVEVGASKLKSLVKALNSAHPSENLEHFSPAVLSQAKAAAFLQNRAELLKARSVFIKSSKCKSNKNKALCPEIFMDVVAGKLAAAAVLFLNFELLCDFYYSFPREFDARLQALTEDQVEALATQDSAIKRHVDLQHRKELLQLALTKLQAISDLRSMESTL